MLPKSLTSALTLRPRIESYSRFSSHLKCVVVQASTNVRLGKCKTQQHMSYLLLKMAFYFMSALWGIQTQSCLNYVGNSRFAIKRPAPGSHFF